jgi:hypothetical protein
LYDLAFPVDEIGRLLEPLDPVDRGLLSARVDKSEIIDTVHARAAPMLPASTALR